MISPSPGKSILTLPEMRFDITDLISLRQWSGLLDIRVNEELFRHQMFIYGQLCRDGLACIAIGKGEGPAAMPTEDGKKKILVRQTNWLGDVIMSLPFLVALRQNEPESFISVLARPSVAEVLDYQPGIDQIIIGDDRKEGLVEMARELQRQNFDTAYLLPNSFSSALMLALAHIPERIGFATDGRGFLLTRKMKKTSRMKALHETMLYLHLLGFDYEVCQAVRPELILLHEEKFKVRNLLAEMGVNASRPLVGMVAGAAYGTAKRWPEDRFAALGRRLVVDINAQVVLFGAPNEQDVAQRIVDLANCPGIFNLAGKTSLRSLAALLDACQLVVTNDTGAMHVAGAVGTPVIAIFGPTNPITTAPVGLEHSLIREPVDCSPCLLRHCPIDHRCMTSIEVGDVFQEVCEKLS